MKTFLVHLSVCREGMLPSIKKPKLVIFKRLILFAKNDFYSFLRHILRSTSLFPHETHHQALEELRQDVLLDLFAVKESVAGTTAPATATAN